MEIINLNKTFEGKGVIKNFSASIAENKITALMGPSGCGKTTLINIIAGLVPADSGTINISAPVSYVFQEDRLLPWLSAEGNIKIAGAGTNFEEICEALEIREFLGEYPAELSGGMKQRLNIARALVFPHKTLLLDEAFKGLDSELKDRVMQSVKYFSRGKTVLSITHDEAEAKDFADEILRLDGSPLALRQ